MSRLCSCEGLPVLHAPRNPQTQAVSAGTKHYFYYMAEARNSPDTAPVVLWQTGGPGCSSLLASFTENGPCLVPETGPNAGKAVFNPYSCASCGAQAPAQGATLRAP
jgi:carboxypeptidase C (cathepsin A)